MKKTENFIINAPRWNAGIYKIGIALYRIKKANLNIICGYTRKRDGKKLWEGSLWVNERFCQKYPIIEYKLKTGKMKLYDVSNAQQNIVDSGQDDFAQPVFDNTDFGQDWKV